MKTEKDMEHSIDVDNREDIKFLENMDETKISRLAAFKSLMTTIVIAMIFPVFTVSCAGNQVTKSSIYQATYNWGVEAEVMEAYEFTTSDIGAMPMIVPIIVLVILATVLIGNKVLCITAAVTFYMMTNLLNVDVVKQVDTSIVKIEFTGWYYYIMLALILAVTSYWWAPKLFGSIELLKKNAVNIVVGSISINLLILTCSIGYNVLACARSPHSEPTLLTRAYAVVSGESSWKEAFKQEDHKAVYNINAEVNELSPEERMALEYSKAYADSFSELEFGTIAEAEGYDMDAAVDSANEIYNEFAYDETKYYSAESAALEGDAGYGYILEDSASRYLSEGELANMSKEKLRLARNEIYAKHGRKFETEDLNQYFNSQPWYSGYLSAEEFDDSVLNGFEKANLDLIKSVEAGGNATVTSYSDIVSGRYESKTLPGVKIYVNEYSSPNETSQYTEIGTMEISDDKIYTLLTIATDGSNLFGIDSEGYYDEITIWDNGRSFYIMSYGDVVFSLVEEYYGN